MESPQQRSFDNLLIRYLILTKLEQIKYKQKLSKMIHDLLNESITHQWYKYCSCDICTHKRLYLV